MLGVCSAHRGMCWEGVVPIGERVQQRRGMMQVLMTVETESSQ